MSETCRFEVRVRPELKGRRRTKQWSISMIMLNVDLFREFDGMKVKVEGHLHVLNAVQEKSD
jgi:hypothetical protein